MFILIKTDGYSIDTTKHNSLTEAQQKMKDAYEELTPIDFDDESSEAEMSYCSDTDATLHTGKDVYVWKICTV